VNNHTVPITNNPNEIEEPLYVLSLLNNELKTTSWKLHLGDYNIGRSSENRIILDDITVSRNHCILHILKDKATLIDLNSTNGLFVNGDLEEKAELNSGDRLQIGKYQFLLTKSQ
jgi:pSer/pThr/pTyr-binding forkhead associated (FHA) protein|tara:strand:- start:68 stop:412 length:345 start_codon:yes stop_codon:yes gene_type:complete